MQTAVDVALDFQRHDICHLLLPLTATKPAAQRQIDLLGNTGRLSGSVEPSTISSSSKIIASPHELEQLHINALHPLPPPAGTTKHDLDQLEGIGEYVVSP